MLRRAHGVSEAILRMQIDELSSTGKSFMPEGFQQKFNPQEIMDLIVYLMSAS